MFHTANSVSSLILPVDKHGISKSFLSFMSGLDKSVGQKTLGPEQTVSGKIQSTLKEAHTRVKSVDEQKGYSKVAREVYHLPHIPSWVLAHTDGTLVLRESSYFALRSKGLVLLHQYFQTSARHSRRSTPYQGGQSCQGCQCAHLSPDRHSNLSVSPCAHPSFSSASAGRVFEIIYS